MSLSISSLTYFLLSINLSSLQHVISGDLTLRNSVLPLWLPTGTRSIRHLMWIVNYPALTKLFFLYLVSLLPFVRSRQSITPNLGLIMISANTLGSGIEQSGGMPDPDHLLI
ncbi:hypothetical protein M8J76_001899 [Diaphorina citri]|nr:hypothetical protein M8J76_001899 [Diaphorina citri]